VIVISPPQVMMDRENFRDLFHCRIARSAGADRFDAPARASQPVPILACENFGRSSAPRLPQAVQTKPGSMSDSLT
jgi:hypothetical protein